MSQSSHFYHSLELTTSSLSSYALSPLGILITFLLALYYRSPPTAQINILTMSLSSKLSITDLDLKDQRVLIRVDFNVP